MRIVLEAAAEKKAEDPVALRLKGITSFADAFVIITGNQRRQTQAICDAILERLGSNGVRPGHVEGYALGDWILVDCGDLVVHIFTRDTRSFYNLEKLWGDAPRLSPEPERRRPARAARSKPRARQG